MAAGLGGWRLAVWQLLAAYRRFKRQLLFLVFFLFGFFLFCFS
jgi:hypothetical protein